MIYTCQDIYVNQLGHLWFNNWLSLLDIKVNVSWPHTLIKKNVSVHIKQFPPSSNIYCGTWKITSSFFVTDDQTTLINSWWPRDESALAHILTCCYTAPNHWLNQWLIIKCVLWRLFKSNFTRRAHELNPWHVFRDDTYNIWISELGHQYLRETSKKYEMKYKCQN